MFEFDKRQFSWTSLFFSELANSDKNKLSIRDRLGLKSISKSEIIGTNEKLATESVTKNDDAPLDPILEARRRKFESKEIKIKEGVIRLRPKEELKVDAKDKQDIQLKPEVAEIKELERIHPTLNWKTKL